jgi:hypothetical protein
MNEREIFDAALQIADDDERSAYLRQVGEMKRGRD